MQATNPARRRTLLLSATAIAGSIFCSGVSAAMPGYPTKPVNIVVAYGAGGDTDVIARLFAEKLAPRLGQPVIVENRPGASGIIGSTHTARSKPDGYTLLLAPSTFVMAPHVVKTNGNTYEPVKDFVPVTQTATQPLFLVASGMSNYRSVADVITAAKEKRPVTYATPGTGSPMHILGELFNQATGVKTLHVPYKGVAPAVSDLLGGHVDLAWMTFGPTEPYLASGKIRVLATAEPTRSTLVPKAPSLTELGFKTVHVPTFQGLYAPKGTDEAIVQLLAGHMAEILAMPDVVAKMRIYGSFAQSSTPAQLATETQKDFEYVGNLVRTFGISAE
jgi:tripartite-type tricarboxylate transporter receptor subunit TctC